MADTTSTSSPLSAAADPAAPATFIFLADPQLTREDHDPSEGYRKKACSDLNAALNNLDASNYPSNFKISCAGQPIGKINAVFFGGDLTQTGGDYDGNDQLLRVPPTYHGGKKELVVVRALYQKNLDFDPKEGVTLLKYDPKYFGLGNHDIQWEYHPHVGWSKGNGEFSLEENYWRYQMWNFISQMHTGYHQEQLPEKDAIYPIDWQSIDSDYGEGTFDWGNYSLNYVVDLGPVDVFQLHRYGGDSDDGRQSGIQWLKDKLEERGTTRPIIIVQHYLFSDTWEHGSITPSWHDTQRDALLDILSPYNIIGFFVGHNHGVGLLPNPIPVPTKNSTRNVPEFRPGCAFNQNFALVRVTPSTMDVLYGTAANKKITWTNGASFKLPFGGQVWETVPDWNGNYFGALKDFYVDTRRVRCPAGKVVVSCGLRRTAGPDPSNRLSWEIVAAKVDDGTLKETVIAAPPAGGSYFPGDGGMSKIYVDLGPVVCPAGSAVVGVFFWQKGNRVAPGLVVRDLTTGAETEVRNTDMHQYFPATGGASDLYADTNMVSRPSGQPDVSDALQMGGVALYQKGSNRLAIKVLYK